MLCKYEFKKYYFFLALSFSIFIQNTDYQYFKYNTEQVSHFFLFFFKKNPLPTTPFSDTRYLPNISTR